MYNKIFIQYLALILAIPLSSPNCRSLTQHQHNGTSTRTNVTSQAKCDTS